MSEVIPFAPVRRPADANRLRLVGAQLGRALDAGQLPVTEPAKAAPSRLIDLVQNPKPLVVWSPTPWQLFTRRLGRALRRIL